MPEPKQPKDTNRRSFLRRVGVGMMGVGTFVSNVDTTHAEAIAQSGANVALPPDNDRLRFPLRAPGGRRRVVSIPYNDVIGASGAAILSGAIMNTGQQGPMVDRREAIRSSLTAVGVMTAAAKVGQEVGQRSAESVIKRDVHFPRKPDSKEESSSGRGRGHLRDRETGEQRTR